MKKMGQNKTLIAYETKGGATEQSAKKIAEVLCSKYQNFFIGGGVRGGKVYDNALKCLENDYVGKQVAFLVSSGDAGDPAKYHQAKVKYIENVIANYPNVKPISMEAFGGRQKILGKTVFDNLDLGRVETWAEELGKKFQK